MEKFIVVVGIWSMCALCAVLFIRGAMAPAARRVKLAEGTQRKTIDGIAQ